MTLVKIRKVISGIIFVLFVLLFLGPEKWSVFLSDVIAPFQFVPSLVQTATAPSGLFMAGFIFIVLMTLIFGRVYCSFLCPLGTLQDLIIAGSRRLGLLPGHAFAGPHNGLRYALLASTAAAAVIGSLSLVSLLDPYSLAGRFFSHFLQPLVVGAYNLGIAALKPFDVYWYPKQTAFVPLSVLAATAAFFLLILYLAATRGRLYCNTVCPVGTFLGLVARFSVFQLTVNPKACSECVRCENVCKAGCIDSHNAFVDMSRCIGCLNCLDACSQSAIRYRRRQRQPHAGAWSPSRRGFVMGGIAAAAALLALNTKLRAWIDIRRAQAEPPVTPPGSRDIAHFTRACTACSLCVSVCPTQVLTPAFMDFGASGLMQPKMNYEKSFCDYECSLCSRVCPTGALASLSLEEKKLTQIGEAELLENICVVYVDHNNCGACGEVCPTHAIRFADKKNILYPEIDRQYCIGCGACQLACPTAPRSIVVHANPVHKKAEKYISPETTVGQKKPADDEFPF
ncbi:MAG: 4Fe-4S dicluster domain-containing protein [Smithellaceae bacterium]|nr:4Fe-4S dicluster domain-containing protein [Smithellaceae bacterium]MDD3258409.1 4Fe-4S dicluster domain-containing protein [Smithellaceae bacterium]MDD3849692.1 4Fe-4S dicluster domain-containing protein [Smithellaceae bacterium]HOG12216.1 4Fe-4S dicluster domain-containing protein [Smithellaceae bacterium]HOQ72514.1 4Fe-4S dicluster domain-containing protein [Smithellaceae bacterium]